MIGEKLGKYRIEAELGRGGMGVVYRAYQPSLERTVAIKVLGQGLVGDPDGVARFRQEARAIARLSHTGIVQVFDIEDEGSVIYLVMEWVDGESLDHVLATRTLPEVRAVGLVAEIAEALQFAHEKGVVHRDIKPANVLLTREGRPKVADFGLAYLLDREGVTKTGFLVGSPSYMSPEQARGLPIDRRTDVYSLGIVLYRMLTGRVPFVAESSHAILFKQIEEAPPDPIDLNAAVSPDVRDVVLKALEKSPDARYASMTAFRKALLATASGRKTQEEDEDATGILLPSDVHEALRRRPEPSGDPSAPTAILSESAKPKPTSTTARAEAPTALLGDERTEAAAPTAPERPQRSQRSALVAGALVAVLVALAAAGLFLSRVGPWRGDGKPTPAPTSPPAPTVAPEPTASRELATPPAPEPTAVVAPTAAPTPLLAEEPTPAPTRPPAPTRRPEAARPTRPHVVVAELRTTPTAAAAVPYCLSLSASSFFQAKTKGFAPGFGTEGGPVGRAARPDFGRISIAIAVEPRQPVPGQRFKVTADVVNDGESDVSLDHVEESEPGSAVSFRPFTGFPTPPRVKVGQTEPVWATEEVLSGPVARTIHVVAPAGDYWTRTFELRPCAR